MRILIYLVSFAILVIVFLCNAWATNAKIITPPGVKFTIKMGGDSTIVIDSPDCSSWAFAQGSLGNARLTCIPIPTP